MPAALDAAIKAAKSVLRVGVLVDGRFAKRTREAFEEDISKYRQLGILVHSGRFMPKTKRAKLLRLNS